VSPAVVTLVAFVRHSVWTWQRIADELGYGHKGHAARAVQRYLAARLIRRSARCTAAPWSAVGGACKHLERAVADRNGDPVAVLALAGVMDALHFGSRWPTVPACARETTLSQVLAAGNPRFSAARGCVRRHMTRPPANARLPLAWWRAPDPGSPR
jgi:hypothetical protein